MRMRLKALLALTAVAASLSACATVNRIDAGGDVHDLLVAIRDNDRAAFDAHVDRRALKGQIEARLMAEARQRAGQNDGVIALAAIAAGPLANAAGEALIRPETFRAAANYYGYTPDRPIPGRVAIAAALRPTGDGRVCAARKDGPCLMTFTREGDRWRLSGFDASAANLRGK
ncbi:DUF2939 domain-containing protein [Caulobacter vibrioides]|uniref:DUF2939 domain-containing protein n=1 Tax=Caulobacter vibrioides TaxID=155892 RepID=UPI000BB4E5B1|nr:DUF2939 domain-containing protein [Caulobacter vibrioides]ATC23061.1 DUF2939 domain-containing protein [Caulobacter vibrioides]AZH11272.1 DUF2939 domain-containing protein [Caulobacter vibrioides]PLR13268.1 DUF2939 domain-containing protein [Caulobacter vibrioides]